MKTPSLLSLLCLSLTAACRHTCALLQLSLPHVCADWSLQHCQAQPSHSKGLWAQLLVSRGWSSSVSLLVTQPVMPTVLHSLLHAFSAAEQFDWQCCTPTYVLQVQLLPEEWYPGLEEPGRRGAVYHWSEPPS